jgi:hypothetical protein
MKRRLRSYIHIIGSMVYLDDKRIYFHFHFDFYFNLIDNDEWFMTQYEENVRKLSSYYDVHGIFR